MDWHHNFCLSCDNQTQDGEKFCSQACRLADLERAGCSEPATPAANSNSNNTLPWDSWQTQTSNSSSSRYQFQLAPPVNFSSYRKSNTFESPPTSPKGRPSAQSVSYFSHRATSSMNASSQPSGRSLTSSPSRSSLSSVSSSGTAMSSSGLSEETMNQLRDYTGAFDQTRDWKRRVTYS